METRLAVPHPSRVAELARADEPARAALEFARFVDPNLEVERYLSKLDAMAGAVRGEGHLALRRVISITQGIGGNVEDYHKPDNSLLNRVLDSRRGLPISLSLIWIEVGRRCGIDVVGVGLPGHFVVYAAGQMCDPFHYGEAIGFDEAAALVATALGGPPRLDKSWLEPVTSVDLIRRMLRNLETTYADLGSDEDLEWVRSCLEAF